MAKIKIMFNPSGKDGAASDGAGMDSGAADGQDSSGGDYESHDKELIQGAIDAIKSGNAKEAISMLEQCLKGEESEDGGSADDGGVGAHLNKALGITE